MRARLDERRQRLAASHAPMARAAARPLGRAYPEMRGEFEGAALLAIVEAAGTFDAGRGVRFGTFARHRVWGALKDVLRTMAPKGWRHDPENAPKIYSLQHDSEEKGRVLNTEEETPVGSGLEAEDDFEALIRPAPERGREALRLLYQEGLGFKAAAGSMGVASTNTVAIRKQEAFQAIRETYRNERR